MSSLSTKSNTTVALLLVFVASLTLACLAVRWARRHLRRLGQPLAALHLPLLLVAPPPTQLEHRLDAARRDALEGFYKCSFCGFENFRRFVFCAVCGSRLRLSEGEVLVTRFETLIEQNRAAGYARGFHRRDIIGARQRRARQRREWTRKLDVENKLFWFRRSSGVPGTRTQDGVGADNVAFPAFVVLFNIRASSKPAKEELEVKRKAECVEGLAEEVNAASLTILSSSKANPGMSPLGVTMHSRDRTKELLDQSATDFPTKYAMFVANTS
ncbi:hypothetical protein Gpo141_00013577, partial [Globisporangium polare]